MSKKLRATCVGVAAVLAVISVSTVLGVTPSGPPTVTGTVTSVDPNDTYSIYLDNGSTLYVLGTTTQIDPTLLVATYPQNLVGMHVSITYQTCNGQNYVLSLVVVS